METYDRRKAAEQQTPPESTAVQQLERIAKAIAQLEGMPVPYRLAVKLADVAREIQTACEPGGAMHAERVYAARVEAERRKT